MGISNSHLKQLIAKRDRKEKKKKEGAVTSKSSSNSNSSLSTYMQTAISTPTTSVKKSSKEGYDFKYTEDGRRYHGNEDSAYMLPNDDDEADRLHQQHWIFRYILQCNFHAPVTKMLKEGITVLDAGCGPGTWTFELADAYPKSKFHGIDITAVFPEKIMPANTSFVIGNIAKNIPFPDNTFDYIHQRLVFAGLTNKDWENNLKESYRVLKPGGYIELAELSFFDPINAGPLMTKLLGVGMDLFRTLDIPPEICGELEDRVIRAGFEKQVLIITPLPLNHDGKRGGLLWGDMKHAKLNFRRATSKICTEWQDVKVYEDFLEACGEELKENKTNINWYVCYAQKPLE